MLYTEVNIERGSEPACYAGLRSRARRALEKAEYRKAEKLFEWAVVEARRQGDAALEERAYCNLIMAANSAGTADRYIPGARAILGQSTDPEARFLAAYNLALAFDCSGARRKARFYAQLAWRQAGELGDGVAGGTAAYHLGKLWLGDSRLRRAQRWIETSIELFDRLSDAHSYALEYSTLGYCLTLQEQTGRALALLEASAEAVSLTGCRLYEPAVRLNFGFAMLEMEDFESACDQAERALSVPGSPLHRKYALYLSGETSSALGYRELARERFGQLQREFYPQLPTLADELAANSTQGFIGWLA